MSKKNELAIGLIQKDKKWYLVRMNYNLDKGQVGDLNLTEMEDLGYAIEAFKLAMEEEVLPETN